MSTAKRLVKDKAGLRAYALIFLLALLFASVAFFGFRFIVTVGEEANGVTDLGKAEKPFFEPNVPEDAERIVLVSTDSTVSVKYLFDGTELYYIRSKNKPSENVEGVITTVIEGIEAPAELRSDGINRIYFEYGKEHHLLYGRLGLIDLCESASGIIRG